MKKFTVSIAFCAHVDVIKIKKTLMFSFERAQITCLMSFRHQRVCNGKTIGSHHNKAKDCINYHLISQAAQAPIVVAQDDHLIAGANGPPVVKETERK